MSEKKILTVGDLRKIEDPQGLNRFQYAVWKKIKNMPQKKKSDFST